MAATNKEFLAQKLANYKKFLRDNSSDPKAVDELENLSPEVFLTFASQNLVPLAASNQLDVAIDKTTEHFKLRATPDVRDKLMRYYNFLIEFLKSIE